MCQPVSMQDSRDNMPQLRIAILLFRIHFAAGSQGFACASGADSPCAQGLPPHGLTLSRQRASAVPCTRRRPARHPAAPDAQARGIIALQLLAI